MLGQITRILKHIWWGHTMSFYMQNIFEVIQRTPHTNMRRFMLPFIIWPVWVFFGSCEQFTASSFHHSITPKTPNNCLSLLSPRTLTETSSLTLIPVLSFHLLGPCVAPQLPVFPASSPPSDRRRPEDHLVSTCPSQGGSHFKTTSLFRLNNWSYLTHISH